VAGRSWAQLDRRGDPRVGMVGGSYGGEVQFAAAAVDRRIDAIAPDIAWNSLVTSLAPNRTNKTAWSALLSLGAQLAGQRNDPRTDQAFAAAQTGFRPTADALQFLGDRGRRDLAARVHVPTLILQGTVDTLFPLDEAAANYAQLRRNRVPVKMVWFCGGHGPCLTDPGDTSVIERETLAWLNRYVKKQRVDTGPGFQWVDQQGVWHSAPTYRPNRAGVSGRGTGTLSLVAAGGSGPGPAQLGPTAAVVATRATNAVDVPIAFRRATSVVGAPVLSLRYRGQAPDPDARVLAQVVDNATGVVLGSQVTPIPVRLDGRTRTVRLPLEYLAATGTTGGFTLQLIAQSSQISTYPQGGSVSFSRIHLTLPTRPRR
jgi:ABC-2 type transport system ATP-binding protein